ncbi:NECA1 protein, partial [Psilopogon haemacephalus]|nr:NECA1 protein [Psilopogon haemacephalus]
MACAELLAVCLLSADRGPAPRRQPLPIFHDVSTAGRARSEPNTDDGKLSFEEFKNYFSDGILNSEELWELFSGIDRRHSDFPDARMLLAHLGTVLIHVGAAAPPMHSQRGLTELSALARQRYESSSKLEQFLTRFLLRETLQQLQSLQGSLECAVDTVEEQAGRERKEVQKPEASLGLRPGRRCGRRGQKNVCLSPTDPYSGMLTTGSCCLAATSRLGASVLPEPALGVGAVGQGGWSGAITPSWSCCGRLSRGKSFRRKTNPHCEGLVAPMWLHCAQCYSCSCSVSACKLTDEACFILYEFWQDVTSWRSHLQSSCSKTFQRSIISLLESPELLTTMLFPASWWIMNNN